MADVESYSVTPASNTGEFPEGQAPSTVNDGGRQVQADVKQAHNRINGDITAGGTADALTAAFTPAHPAHRAGRVLVITAAAANAATTPTFTLDALAAKTITKNGGQALVAGDIYGAGHELILKDAGTYYELMNPATSTASVTLTGLTSTIAELNILDGVTSTAAELNILDGVTSTAAELNILDGVTATTAEINELDESARTVSGYVSGVTEYIEGDSGSGATAFDVSTNIGAAWESVGPTGSGATNIWATLDIVPTGAKWIEVKIFNYCEDTTGGTINQVIYGRVGGSSTAIAPNNTISKIQLRDVTASNHRIEYLCTAKIPIDSSNIFDLYATLSGTSQTVDIYLIGWGI